MFFCKDCAENNRWPESFLTSYGPCEVCGTRTHCSEVPSRYLPPAKPKKSIDIDSIT